jgi:hypothetical protein
MGEIAAPGVKKADVCNVKERHNKHTNHVKTASKNLMQASSSE